jgi:1-deoxy-D-xylulose-5-phosphate reductoisomerase
VALAAQSNHLRLLRAMPRVPAGGGGPGGSPEAAALELAGIAAWPADAVLAGPEGLAEVAAWSTAQQVMAAIVGAAGLASPRSRRPAGQARAARQQGGAGLCRAAPAEAVARHGRSWCRSTASTTRSSSACRRCRGQRAPGVRRILLTASGGPFLRTPAVDRSPDVTPEQAVAHPNWSMGRKISVDSATLMNKGLELIEACLLFGVGPETVEVVVHPQSIIHSMVEYVDGSVLAQLGNPDMRTPIAHALGWPERIESGVQSLDLVRVGRARFRGAGSGAVSLPQDRACRAESGGTAPAVLNAANEVAVAAFLEGG